MEVSINQIRENGHKLNARSYTNTGECSKGWAVRCADARSRICECACGGKNHGKNHGITDAGPRERTNQERSNAPKVVQVRDLSGEIHGEARTRRVYVRGKELRPTLSLKFRNHSPDGFMWGYGGSGPSQLALAILLELLGSQKAVRLYHDFKFTFLASFPSDQDFRMTVEEVYQWADSKA